jgi:glycosyltransferase involved in cell wall biosynthesis
MTISIAMATYNGAKYLQEQLDSFAAQTHLPDELVVTDDGSTDTTMSILEEFARSAPFDVRIYKNDNNLGYARNFGRAMSLCSGDLVFLSDQDDIWFKERIEKIAAIAECNPEVMLFINDAELTRGDGTALGLTKLGQTLSLGLNESDFTTGCCMAMRKAFIDFALPVPEHPFVHDTWLNHLALFLRVRKVVPTVMQYYRRHGDNTSSWIASRTTKQSRFDLIRAYKDKDPRPHATERLGKLALLEERLTTGSTSVLQAPSMNERAQQALVKIQHERNAVESRLRFLGQSRWRRWVPASCFYFSGQYNYFSGWKSLFKDIIGK